MGFDESLVEKILQSEPTWTINVQKKQYVPSSVDIVESVIPVKKPSMRGGVYFSQTKAYKIRCCIEDSSVATVLTGTMLGPNTEFVPIKLTASVCSSKYVIMANLTNYVQTKNDTQLNLIIVDVFD